MRTYNQTTISSRRPTIFTNANRSRRDHWSTARNYLAK